MVRVRHVGRQVGSDHTSGGREGSAGGPEERRRAMSRCKEKSRESRKKERRSMNYVTVDEVSLAVLMTVQYHQPHVPVFDHSHYG